MEDHEIKNIAINLLSISGVPVNLKKLIQHFGVKAISISMPLSVSGFVMLDPYRQQRFVLAVNNRMPYYHRRFTVAHELWHIMRDKGEIMYRWQIDTSFTGKERQANIFATELLMPEGAVLERYRNGWREVARYCKFFKVSKKAMEIRLFEELKLNREDFE